MSAQPLLKIASGGMATVFVGVRRGERGLRQIVAVKRPHPHLLDDPGFRDALFAEARVTALLHHANIVDLRDVEEVDGALQLVMDYVEGVSLFELLARGADRGPKLPTAVAVRVVLDACAGLHAAHQAVDDQGAALGLVHRDVSPQNLLVGVDGITRVTDFGTAKCLASAEKPTTVGSLKGKVGYMAPEYIRGKAIDRRIDVFALGVVLWEALAGKRLFRGESEGQTLERILRGDVPDLSSIGPSLSRFQPVVARALAVSADERPGTAAELAAELERAAEGVLAAHTDVAAHVQLAFGESLRARGVELRARLAEAPTEIAKTPAPPAPSEPPAQARRSLGPLVLVAVVGVVGVGGAAIAIGFATRETGLPPRTPTASTSSAASAPSSAPTTTSSAPITPETSPSSTSATSAITATSATSTSAAPKPRPPVFAPPTKSAPTAASSTAPHKGPPPNPYASTGGK